MNTVKNLVLTVALVLLVLGCTSSNQSAASNSSDESSRVLIDQQTYLLTEQAQDDSYGFTEDNPVKVGGVKEEMGPINQRRFLNALQGPNGEEIEYNRQGSCCGFETPNGFMGMGLLDVYSVYWEGSSDTLDVYMNLYDTGELFIPVGLTAKEM